MRNFQKFTLKPEKTLYKMKNIEINGKNALMVAVEIL